MDLLAGCPWEPESPPVSFCYVVCLRNMQAKAGGLLILRPLPVPLRLPCGQSALRLGLWILGADVFRVCQTVDLNGVAGVVGTFYIENQCVNIHMMPIHMRAVIQ